MEHKLMFGALGVGVLGWICLAALCVSRTGPVATEPEIESARGAKWLAFLLPIFVWAATLPIKAPFSSGQGFGRGFLLGGLIAFLSIWMIDAAIKRGANLRAAGAISPFGALVAASVPLLWMRSAVIEALLGGALGWIAVALVWLLAIQTKREPESARDGLSTLILNGAAFSATLSGAATLGVYRDFVARDVARGTFPAVALTLAASVALLFLVGALVDAIAPRKEEPSVAANAFRFALAVIVPLGAAYLLSTRILEDLAAFNATATGVALGGLLWFLSRDAAFSGEQPARMPLPAVLIALCAFMLSYQIAQGFGVGLMLLAAWPASLLALPKALSAPRAAESGDAKVLARASTFEIAHTLSLLAAFGALTLFCRVFATRYRADLRGASLDDQFALFGFLAGAVLPHLLCSGWFERRNPNSRSLWQMLPDSNSSARLFGLGVFATVLPAAMLLLWGIKIGPAFLLGLALAVALGEAGASRTQKSALALWAMGLSIGVCAWSQRFLPLAEISRAQRLNWLFWALGTTLVLLVVLDYGARLLVWNRSRAAKTEVAL